MEGEVKSFIKVWFCALTSLCYCYYIVSKLPKGFLRLFSLLPIFYLFLILPLNLSSFHLGVTTAFFLIWLTISKLLLFSFDQPPLSPPPPNLYHFICLASLPIKLKQDPPPAPNPQILVPKCIFVALKVALIAGLFNVYRYKLYLHQNLVLLLYCFHTYLELEIILALVAVPARAIFGLEIEPQFNKPYLATSLQDFWGRRWNLMVSSILRPTIYHPVRHISTRIFGPTWAQGSAIITTFAVSGLMHELLYYYIIRRPPTWEVTGFFVLQGICTAIEVMVKKVAVTCSWRLHPSVSRPLTVGFVAVTGIWLFFPQLVTNGVDEKAIKEYFTFIDFVKGHLPISLFWSQAGHINI